MEKNVLPWLERKERSTITLGMACGVEEKEGGSAVEAPKTAEAPKAAAKEAAPKKKRAAPKK